MGLFQRDTGHYTITYQNQSRPNPLGEYETQHWQLSGFATGLMSPKVRYRMGSLQVLAQRRYRIRKRALGYCAYGGCWNETTGRVYCAVHLRQYRLQQRDRVKRDGGPGLLTTAD